MRVDISICFHSIKADKVLETDNGEILHHVYPTGSLRHETWFRDLDEGIKAQILTQIPDAAFLNQMPRFEAA